ncbi:hypothetical protein LF845_07200 [Deferribacterales bacterium Es71-Z0220]|uniref:hypothetical protein n=1 Tax=Deferrivibrio essentukiensis TaxID=2880922 RepID=UPI001F60DF15|nr:hypothetical protein [Deferrivibrio essentukiensis]MCB4204745.1 hypothetical protein [Deferrivibrio essentukiensis]
MKIKTFILLSIFFLLLACGKKTDPIPLDTLILPQVEVEKVLKLDDNGVLIKNISKYVLYVEKAEVIGDCAQEFSVIAKIEPKGNYIDNNVTKGVDYIYRLFNVDENIKVASKEVTKKITFNYPVKVEKFESSLLSDKYLKAELYFSDEIGYYEVYLNSKLVKKSKQMQLELPLEDKDINTVEIIPYDKYFNKGIVFKKDFISYSKYLLPNVKGVKFIDKGGSFILSWDSVRGATGYKIYLIENTDKKFIEMSKENFRVLQKNGRCVFGISAFNDYTESNLSIINICGKSIK